jgi:O-antigen ligase
MFIRVIKANITWLIDKKEKIFVASLLLSYHLVGLTGRKIDITDFVFLVVLFLWLIYIFANKHYKIIWSYWHLLFLILSLSILLSLLNGDYMSLVFLLRVFKAFTVFFIMVNMIRDRETAIFSLKIYLSLATFSAVIGIIQEIVFFYSGISFFVAPFVPEANVDYMYEATFFGEAVRVAAFTGWYLNLDYFLVTALVTGVNLMFYSVFSKRRERLFLLTALFLMSIGLFLTFSFGSVLVVILAVVISIFVRWRSLTLYFITIVFFGLLIVFSGFTTDSVEEVKQYMAKQDVALRLELLRQGIAGFIHRHPFIGAGLQRGGTYISDVDGWAAHNNIVLVADELGILGVFAYAALFLTAMGKQVTSILKMKNEKDKAVLLSLLISIIALMTDLQFQSLYLNVFLFMYLGLVEGTRKALSYKVPSESNAKSET